MATYSAPGKVFLFGEHAVVYGKPGIAMAIKPRVHVTVRKGRYPPSLKSPYLESCFHEFGVTGSLYINSQLPSSSGLGSSAAVTVATLSAINDEYGFEQTRDEIAQIAYGIEKRVQLGRASPTDTQVATYGGIVMMKNGVRRTLPPQDFQLVIGNTQISHSTAQLVEDVADFRRNHPAVAGSLIDSIETVTRQALFHLQDQECLGRYMDINHALLDALGVGHPMLTTLVTAARDAGAYGAKMTGAGGGGSMIALCPKREKKQVARAIDAAGGRSIVTSLDTEGVRKEQ